MATMKNQKGNGFNAIPALPKPLFDPLNSRKSLEIAPDRADNAAIREALDDVALTLDGHMEVVNPFVDGALGGDGEISKNNENAGIGAIQAFKDWWEDLFFEGVSATDIDD